MEVTPFRYQASIFTNSDDIKPEPTTIHVLFNEFVKWEVFPNVVKERVLNITNNNGTLKPVEVNIDRLQFTSSSQNKKINFLSKRIDFEKVAFPGNPIGDLKDFCGQVIELIKVINLYSPKKANRISLVCSYYCPNTDTNYMNTCYQALFSASNLPLENSVPVDWSHRVTHRKPFLINGKEEKTNIITTFGRGFQPPTGSDATAKDRLEFHFDLNTYQNNTDYRFNLNDFEDFYLNMSSVSDELKDDVIKLFLNL